MANPAHLNPCINVCCDRKRTLSSSTQCAPTVIRVNSLTKIWAKRPRSSSTEHITTIASSPLYNAAHSVEFNLNPKAPIDTEQRKKGDRILSTNATMSHKANTPGSSCATFAILCNADSRKRQCVENIDFLASKMLCKRTENLSVVNNGNIHSTAEKLAHSQPQSKPKRTKMVSNAGV